MSSAEPGTKKIGDLLKAESGNCFVKEAYQIFAKRKKIEKTDKHRREK
jgi:hypothetical protein